MPKNKVSEWSSTAASNTDIGGIDIAEGCAPSGINNAIRELMAQVKDQQAGTDADNFTVGGNLSVTGTSTLTGAITATAGVTGNLTGNVTGNVTGDVTGTSANVTGTVAVANGGTGLTTLTANNVILGNGTSTPSFVAPSTSGNILTSNGTTWASAAAPTGITATTGSTPYYAARAWVNFNGTDTVAIRSSANVSSITDNNTGDYTVNFTSAMPDANYVGLVSCGGGSINSGAFGGSRAPTQDDPTTTTFRLRTVTESDSAQDLQFVSVAFFR
jgi:hypothetical protein